jgi:hypothetical protein
MAQRTKLLTAIEVLPQRDSIAARIGFHCRTLRWPPSNTWPRSAMFPGMKAGKPLSNMSRRQHEPRIAVTVHHPDVANLESMFESQPRPAAILPFIIIITIMTL